MINTICNTGKGHTLNYFFCKLFYLFQNRAANNGRSTNNVRSKLGTDRTNPWIVGHLVGSFTDSLKETLIFNCLIITRDNSHVSERKKKTNIKVDKLVVAKFPAVANFLNVIKSCRDRKSSCLPLFYLLYVSVPS